MGEGQGAGGREGSQTPNPDDTIPALPSRHSLHAIAAQLSPVPGCTGIELLEADTFDLHCLEVSVCLGWEVWIGKVWVVSFSWAHWHRAAGGGYP